MRSLLLQLALAHPPGEIEIAALDEREHWTAALPHAARPAPRRVVWARPGRPLPEADLVLLCVQPGEPVPSRCAAVVTLTGPAPARVAVGEGPHAAVVESGAGQRGMVGKRGAVS